MIDKTAYRDALAKLYPDPTERESRLASLEEIINAAASYDKNRRASSPPSLSGFLDDMLLNERDDSDEKESQLARNAVALMTLHSAKGLEFPRVYLVGMEEGILPHKRSRRSGERRGDRRRTAAVLRRRHAGPRASDALVRPHAPQMGQAAKDDPQPVPLRNDRPGREFPAGKRTGNEGDVAGFAGGSNDQISFGRAAKIFVDPKENEAYIADGYLNKRVAVIDADTGKMKRWWGAYGNKPDDTPLAAYDPSAPPAQQFRNPVHCADMSVDRMIYVCDRVGDRLQVFTPQGKFVEEGFYEKNTLNSGSVWDIAFSKDPQQKYIFMTDGVNEKVKIIDRQTLQELTTFGDGGRQPGQFYGVHSIAIDSKGNLYTTETYEGKRVQRFIYKGMAPVTKMNQGTVWPASK